MIGAVLILASTVLGARLLGTSDDAVTVWAARRDLPAGLALRAGDLERRQVHFDHGAAQYVAASTSVPDGLILARAVGSGELLPVGAIAAQGAAPDVRVVTLPVEQFHVADDLARGEHVDVYVTPHATSAESSGVGQARLLAAGVTVVDVDQNGGRFGSAGASRGIAVAVPTRSVAGLIGGLGGGTVDVVRVDRASR